jgi:hypothetical protein
MRGLVQYPIPSAPKAGSYDAFPFPQPFANASGAATNRADTGTALGCVAVTEYGTEYTTNYTARYRPGYRFLTDGDLIRIVLALRQITVVGNHVDTLSIDNGIVSSHLFNTGTGSQQGDR